VRLFGRWPPAERFPLVASKFGRIYELVEGKDVLDCGAIGDVAETPEEAKLASHEQFAKRAKYCLGIDIWKEEVDKRRAMGYNIVYGNVETMSLGRQFDVIVASDLIEHLANPGMFLERAREHLRDGGLLCLVTPNAHSLNVSAKAILGVSVAINREHTCWYDPTTLKQLVTRFMFKPQEEYWQDYQQKPVVGIAVRLRPNLAAHYILIASKEAVGAAR